MTGKKKDDFEWLKERINYLTDNEAFRQVNSMGYSPITTFRPVCLDSAEGAGDVCKQCERWKGEWEVNEMFGNREILKR